MVNKVTLRTRTIDRLMEYEGYYKHQLEPSDDNDGYFGCRARVRATLRKCWGLGINSPYSGISPDDMVVENCEQLCGPHGYSIWKAMKAKHDQG